MRLIGPILVILSLVYCENAKNQLVSSRNKININSDWQFVKNEAATPIGLSESLSWRSIDLPHDWGIEGPFTKDVSYKGGYLPFPGVGWYRKKFTPNKNTEKLRLEFDGIMRDAKVFLNGENIGGWKFGYTSFAIDISEKVEKRDREHFGSSS